MSKGCRRCATQQTQLTVAEDEIRRVARRLARTQRPTRLAAIKEELVIAKANLTMARDAIALGHECDNRLTDEHWTKARA